MPIVVMGIAAVGALAVLLRFTLPLPSGPVSVSFGREPCADCQRQIIDPHFAAQLQTSDGRVVNFDDPGCLLRYLRSRKPKVHAVYFHDLKEDRWLERSKVAFVPVRSSPEGYNLAAVEIGTAGSLSYEAALARIPENPIRPPLNSD